MASYVVGKKSDFTPGSRKIVNVGGRSIGVFYIGGEFFAIRNRCPHAGAPLCEGVLGGVATAPEPGTYRYSRKNEFIRCPWHSWEFDLRTGQSQIDPNRIRVRAYQTQVVQVCELAAATADDGPPPAVETYPVTVEHEYVQVEL